MFSVLLSSLLYYSVFPNSHIMCVCVCMCLFTSRCSCLSLGMSHPLHGCSWNTERHAELLTQHRDGQIHCGHVPQHPRDKTPPALMHTHTYTPCTEFTVVFSTHFSIIASTIGTKLWIMFHCFETKSIQWPYRSNFMSRFLPQTTPHLYSVYVTEKGKRKDKKGKTQLIPILAELLPWWWCFSGSFCSILHKCS